MPLQIIPLLAAALICSPALADQQLKLAPCRFTVDPSYNLLLCEKQDQCSREQPSSSTVCNRYTYVQIVETSQCMKTCCPQLDPNTVDLNANITDLSPTLVRRCYKQWQIRYVVKIVSIVFGVVGVFAVFLAIGYSYLNCFIKNPYTGRRVYVGCWCCKKNIDLEKDYLEQMGSKDSLPNQSEKGVMEMYRVRRHRPIPP